MLIFSDMITMLAIYPFRLREADAGAAMICYDMLMSLEDYAITPIYDAIISPLSFRRHTPYFRCLRFAFSYAITLLADYAISLFDILPLLLICY